MIVCAMCGGERYLTDPPNSTCGELVPCPRCNPSESASTTGRKHGAFPRQTPILQKPIPVTGGPWSPAQTAQMLKAGLYALVGLGLYGLCRLGSAAQSREHTSEPDVAVPDDHAYSLWEPEP